MDNKTAKEDGEKDKEINASLAYAPQPFMNREARRRGLSKAGRRPFLNKSGTKIISVKEQAKGAFGKCRYSTTKYSADMHKWVDPSEVKPKKSKKATLKPKD